MSKTAVIILAIVVILGGIYLMTLSANPTPNSDININTNTEQPIGEQNSDATGRVVVSVTDAAADMSTISEITLKLNKVELKSKTEGWVTVSSTPKTYNLLALDANNRSELFADITTKVGTYDQARLTIDSVTVKSKTGATKVARLPSKVMTIDTTLSVSEGSTASLNFDFLASESTFITTSQEYVFAPVVKTTAESGANVEVGADSAVKISDGKVTSSTTVGMDVDGSLKLDFELDESQKIQIDASGKIKIGS